MQGQPPCRHRGVGAGGGVTLAAPEVVRARHEAWLDTARRRLEETAVQCPGLVGVVPRSVVEPMREEIAAGRRHGGGCALTEVNTPPSTGATIPPESGPTGGRSIMKIGEICSRSVVHTTRSTSIRDAAELMRYHHVGDLVLTEQGGEGLRPVGIVTDRDLVVEILAKGVDPDSVTLADLVTTELVTIAEQATVFECSQLMQARGIRRIPVVDAAGTLVGIVSLDDLLEFIAEEIGLLSRISPRQAAREADARP